MSDAKYDLIQRGSHPPSPVGTITFVLLRGLEPFLQLYLLLASPLTTLLLPVLGIHIPLSPYNDPAALSYSSPATVPGPFSVILNFYGALGSFLNLSPWQTNLFVMSVLAATKHNYWVLVVSKEKMPVSFALIVAAFNAGNNALNILLFSLLSVNPTFPSAFSVPPPSLFLLNLFCGTLLFSVGLGCEAMSEIQRRSFKEDPRNKGKLFMGGLFGLARNINYGSYMTWRTGFALVAGGPLWAALVGSFFFWDFSNRGVPVMEEYCEKRYGARPWEEFKKKVPYRLIPGVY